MSSGLLGLFGLARLGQLRAATGRAVQLKTRMAELKERLETGRQDVERWKRKAGEATTRLAATSRETERWKSKNAGHLDELNRLLDKFRRLESAEQNVALARGHLLAMETKLDVIEGAINVLDRRTRDRVASPDPDPVAADPVATSHRD